MKIKKKNLTDRACAEIQGFYERINNLRNRILVEGKSESTARNYISTLAGLSLTFNKLPESISEKELNKYLASLISGREQPAYSRIKHTVFGLLFGAKVKRER